MGRPVIAADNILGSVGSPGAAAKAFLIDWASRKIRGFEGTIDENGTYLSKIYSTANSISEQIAADYHGRFLIELIQNAHDVHSDQRRDGQIEVLFDAGAGAHGVLYVANGGSPFAQSNVEALSDLGLSSKPPGQAIGNKGLGFRSVRHICDAPEIYSQGAGWAGADRFHGYCFRFATGSDLALMTSGPRALELALKDLPPFHVPVWLDAQPDEIRAFARRGFSTVIALPVRDARAAGVVLTEIEALGVVGAPILLFLARLARLDVRVTGVEGGQFKPILLTRGEEGLSGAPEGLVVADLGLAGRHLITRCAVGEAAMIEAITAGIEQTQLHSHFAEWRGDGEVALAVRLDKTSDGPSRLYTFLPMGEQANSPFNGYLHASFFPTANRKGLDGKIRLNAMLLEMAADLAARTVAWLVRDEGHLARGLTAEERALAAVDLLCWHKTQSFETSADLPLRVAKGVAVAMGVTEYADAAIAPVFTSAGSDAPTLSWRNPGVSRRFVGVGETFSLTAAARHAVDVGAWPLWPGLGSRTDALISFTKAQVSGYAELPTAVERVRLAVAVAAALPCDTLFPVPVWTAYYKDLPEFIGTGGNALADTFILLCDDGRVRPSMSALVPAQDTQSNGRRRVRRTGRVAVFAPPARKGPDDDEASDLSPPNALAENFAFLCERLDWYGELADARNFLLRHKLVLDFDRENILNQLSRVLRDDDRHQPRAAGLRWAFQIWRRPQGKGRGISLPANLRLYVPTMGQGFVPAEDAFFSDAWPDETRGRLLQRFLDAAPSDCSDLRAIAQRRLAKPDHYAFKVGNTGLWTEFLRELGVKRGLHPIQKSVSGTHRGQSLDGTAFWRGQGLTDAATAAWKTAIASERPSPLSPYSHYSISGTLQWLPGQWDLERFDREALEYYALLIIAWLAEPLPQTWSLTIRHSHFTQSDIRHWSTPLRVFLYQAAWIPAMQPTSTGMRAVAVRPSQIWMAAETGERFPFFLRRPAIPVMRALDRAATPHLAAIRKQTALSALDDPATLLQQAAFLASQFATTGFDTFYERQMANLYFATWQRIAEHYRTVAFPKPESAPSLVLARRLGVLHAFWLRGADATAEPIYVRDVDNETAASLVEAAGKPMLEIRAGDKERLGQILESFYGERVRLLSKTDYRITIDGRDVGTGDMIAAVEWCPRLTLMVAIAMEGVKGLDARNLPVNRQSILDRLNRVMIQTGSRLGFRLDDFAHDELEGGPEALGLKLADGHAVIVVRTDEPRGWNQLDQSLAMLCDALGHPGLEQALRILLRCLQACGAAIGDPGEPDRELDDLCASLRLTPRSHRIVRETLGGGLERHLPWLRALLYMAGGQVAVDTFAGHETEAVQDASRLRQAIAPWLAPLGCDAQTALDACRTALSVSELRDSLQLNFEGLNWALSAVGQSPDTYPDIHARLLSNRIKAVSVAIADSLRATFAHTVAAGSPAPGYALARDSAAALSPDPAWAMRWKEVPDTVLDQHIDAWLATHGAPPRSTACPGLLPLEEVRRSNNQVLKTLTLAAAPLVRAWCSARSASIPAPWAGPDGGFGELRTRLDQAGIIDIQIGDQNTLLGWIDRLGCWPANMKLTLDRDALELGDAALAQARAKAEADVAERRKHERSIEFNGRPVDPEETDWAALDAELKLTLSAEFFKTPVDQHASLAPARPGGGKSGSGGQTGSHHGHGNGGRPFAPSAKTDMIGRLGELAVRHWLKASMPKQDIDAAWKSGNAEIFTGRKGNDGLGFDFEVSWQRQTWQIEVKASVNDPRVFEMGETEVRAGRIAARTRSGLLYWIAYVSNLADPARARVEMIPNPVSEAGEAVLELVGEGLRYSFRRP
ncbi:sacsin N-terminal ATP-binding-like domain-containing protein [Rhizobium herbae]